MCETFLLLLSAYPRAYSSLYICSLPRESCRLPCAAARWGQLWLSVPSTRAAGPRAAACLQQWGGMVLLQTTGPEHQSCWCWISSAWNRMQTGTRVPSPRTGGAADLFKGLCVSVGGFCHEPVPDLYLVDHTEAGAVDFGKHQHLLAHQVALEGIWCLSYAQREFSVYIWTRFLSALTLGHFMTVFQICTQFCCSPCNPPKKKLLGRKWLKVNPFNFPYCSRIFNFMEKIYILGAPLNLCATSGFQDFLFHYYSWVHRFGTSLVVLEPFTL